MKIAQVTLRFAAPGGVEAMVHAVARGLRAAGDDVEVFASDLWDESGWKIRPDRPREVDGIPVHWLPVRKKLIPGLTMPLMVGLVDALREARPDVIHAHSHRYGHLLLASEVARELGIPLVVSTHYHPADPDEPPQKRALLRLQDHLFGMTAYRSARALVAETEAEARQLRQFAPADRIRVIPPGIDLAEWARPEPPAVELHLPARYILFSGRLAPNKGLGFLLRAYARIPPSERVPLILMGPDWGMRAALETLSRELGIDPEIRFLGNVDDDRTFRSVVRGASVFVLPSAYEAFGLVLLQAMFCEVPVVATAVGGVPEVLDEGRAGQLVPYEDLPALSKALQSALAGGEPIRGMVDRGRRRAREFDWSETVSRFRTLYRELAPNAN